MGLAGERFVLEIQEDKAILSTMFMHQENHIFRRWIT